MHRLQASLLGEPLIYGEDDRPIHFHSRKEKELFCFLLLHRGRPRSREALASLLWSETTTDRSKKYFRDVLWHLRSNLGEQPGGRPFVLTTNHTVTLHPEASIWLDVDVLEEVFRWLCGRAGASLSAAEARGLEATLALYQGDLLAGWDCDWCHYKRERLRHAYFTLGRRYMTYCEALGAYDRGVAAGLRLLCTEPTLEDAHRAVMRLYFLAGDRGSALRQYQRCAAVLRREFDVDPLPQTSSLREQIRTGRLEEPSLRSSLPSFRWNDVFHDVQQHLADLRTQLEDLEPPARHASGTASLPALPADHAPE